MDDILKQIYNACDPDKPATDEYYLDCSSARGSSALTQKFQSHLELTKPGDYLRFLFSGHLGCGKSSELEQLRHALMHPISPHSRYFPVLLEEVKQYFLSDLELSEGVLSLGAAKLKIQRLKRDPTARQRVREALQSQMSTMLEEMNTVFDEARIALKKIKPQADGQSYTDIVLILDNLEKIQRMNGQKEGLESQRELFIERAPQLTGLQTHVIYTVPLRLVRSDGPQLQQPYGIAPFVLPMVKVIERGTQRPFQSGMDCLRALLKKRLSGLALDEAFALEAMDFLLKYSGGHVRNLMMFVREACTYGEVPIPLKAAHQAIAPTVRLYSSAIPDSHWEKLARLDSASRQKIPNSEDAYLMMLENLSILEYVNGGSDTLFADVQPWYAVNPIVRELQEFKEARSALSVTTPS